jgi:hypothetical protein
MEFQEHFPFEACFETFVGSIFEGGLSRGLVGVEAVAVSGAA